MNFEKIISDAKSSKFGLWKMNFGLARMIPFNKPHGIKVKEINDLGVTTTIPFKRKNQNHIRGIHACGLATCAEFASGLSLLTRLEVKKYRIIMESIEMKFHYQAKTAIDAKFEASDDWINENIIEPLKTQESVMVKCEIELHDTENNHVATGYTNWQIKDWSKVKTKL